jgi:hypothetical protein
MIASQVIESDPPRKLVQTWHPLFDAAIACSKIPSDAMAILLVSPAVMPLQIFFFA